MVRNGLLNARYHVNFELLMHSIDKGAWLYFNSLFNINNNNNSSYITQKQRATAEVLFQVARFFWYTRYSKEFEQR